MFLLNASKALSQTKSLTLQVARSAGNPEQLAAYFVDALGESIQRLAKRISQDLYVGDSTAVPRQIVGLLDAAGGISDSGTYAGIDRAVYPQWASNIEDAAGAALTRDLMRSMRTSIYKACGAKPDLIVCSPEQHEAYGKTFGPERRYVDNVRMRGRNIRLDGGYAVLEFDGIPVVEDNDCPADVMLFLNTREVYMSQLPDAVDSINRAMSMTGLKGTSEEQLGEGTMPIQAKIQPLAVSGHAYKFQLICALQLCVRKPNCCGAITGLAI